MHIISNPPFPKRLPNTTLDFGFATSKYRPLTAQLSRDSDVNPVSIGRRPFLHTAQWPDFHGTSSSQSQLSFMMPSHHVFPSFPPPSPQSTKVLNFVISSSISCKSASLILFVRLGIRVLASSALSQHKLAAFPSTSCQPFFITRGLKMGNVRMYV